MSSVGVALSVPWSAAGAFGCWLLRGGAPTGRSGDNYPGAPGPVYVERDGVARAIHEVSAAIRHAITDMRHLTVAPADPGLPAGCLLLSEALDAGACLLVHADAAWQVWVPTIDRAGHRPAIVWRAAPIAEPAPLARGTARSDFRRALLTTAAAVQDLDVLVGRVWQGSQGTSSTDSMDDRGVDPVDGILTTNYVPSLPRTVPMELRVELQRVLAVRAGVSAALKALTAGGQTAGRGRVTALREQVDSLSILQSTARAYTDDLWNQALQSCR